jgi:hypothetical protein
MAEVRSRTLAFRTTKAERQIIDTVARGVGLETSEYARRAVRDGAMISAQALNAARDEGRAEVRRELAATQDALDRATVASAAWQRRAEALGQVESELGATRQRLASMTEACALLRRKAESLEAKLDRAPEELVVAIKQLIAGAPDARTEVAQLWARIRPHPYFDREESQEIIAAEVADAIESIVTRFRTDGAAFAEWPNLRQRIEWLFEGLHLDAGKGFRGGGGRPDAVWKPVVDALDHADDARRRHSDDFATDI